MPPSPSLEPGGGENAGGLCLASDAWLLGNRCFVLTPDKRILCFYVNDPKTFSSVTASSSGASSASLHRWILQRTLALPAEIVGLELDEEGEFLAFICEETLGEDGSEESAFQTVEIWQTAEPARLHTSLTVSSLDGDNQHDPFDGIEFRGDYLLLQRDSGFTEVRYWRMSLGREMGWPTAWDSGALSETAGALLNLQLIWPNFLFVHVSLPKTKAEDPATSELRLYRLGHTSSRHVLSFQFPEPSAGSKSLTVLGCGASISPGEDGLVVIAATGNFVSV